MVLLFLRVCDIVQGPHPLWGTSINLSAAGNLLPLAAASGEAPGADGTGSGSASQADPCCPAPALGVRALGEQ